MSGEQRRKRGKREARVAREGKSPKKITPVTHTIVQAIPALKYERGFPIGYFTSRDP